MLALFLDADSMDRDLVRGLRVRNVDVTTADEAGTLRFADEDQLKFATSQGRVIYTANVQDFARIHHSWLVGGQSHSGIVLLSNQSTDIGVQIMALARLAETMDSATMQDRMEFLKDWIR